MLNILVIQSHFAPYRDDTFAYLQRNYNVKLKFYNYFNIPENHKEWNYSFRDFEYEILGPQMFNNKIEYRKGLFSAIKKEKFDICICSSLAATLIIKTLYSQKRVILCADTIQNNVSTPIKKFLLKRFYSLYDAVFVPGNLSKAYFTKWGVPETNIYEGSYTNDAERIIGKIKAISGKQRNAIRKKYCQNNEFLFLFIGKLIKSRRVDVLLKCATNLSNKPIKFLIIGDGEQKNLVDEYVQYYSNVINIPSVPLDDLETYYAISDAYIHPGWEPYSLAVYEAAIAGLPIVASGRIGAMRDCTKNGFNSIWVENEDEMKTAISFVAANGLSNENMKRVQDFILKNRGIRWAGDNLASACGIIKNKMSGDVSENNSD